MVKKNVFVNSLWKRKLIKQSHEAQRKRSVSDPIMEFKHPGSKITDTWIQRETT